MKTLEELRAFAQGYLEGALACNAILSGFDDWVIWGGYDINFAGADYTDVATDKTLHVDAYKAGWVNDIGAPLHIFTITEETSK